MSRRLTLIAALAATVAAGAFICAPASANNVAWSVSVGVPGLAISAGVPAFGIAAPVYGPAYRPARAHAPYRPYYRGWAPAPVVAAYPYPYPSPFAAAIAYPAPVVVAPRVYAPRRVVVAPYRHLPPSPAPYGWN